VREANLVVGRQTCIGQFHPGAPSAPNPGQVWVRTGIERIKHPPSSDSEAHSVLAPIAGVPTSSSTSIEFHDKTTTDTRCAALEDTCIIGNSASSLGRRRINRGIRARLPWGVAAMHCSRTVSGLVSIAALTTEMPWVVLGVDPSSHRPSPRGRLFAALCRRTRQALLASQGGFRQPLKIASLCIFWEDLDSLRHCASVPSSALLKHARREVEDSLAPRALKQCHLCAPRLICTVFALCLWGPRPNFSRPPLKQDFFLSRLQVLFHAQHWQPRNQPKYG